MSRCPTITASSTGARRCRSWWASSSASRRPIACYWRYDMPVATISAADLKRQLDEGQKLRLVDVREPAEWTSELGHIAGAELIPLGTVAANLSKLQGEEREIVAICKSGMRSQQAADFLAKNGLKVRNLQGGMMAWKGAGLQTTREP